MFDVKFISVMLYIVQIDSEQLHSDEQENNCVSVIVTKFIRYETNSKAALEKTVVSLFFFWHNLPVFSHVFFICF